MREKDVELLGMAALMFEQMGELLERVVKPLSLLSAPTKSGQTSMVARINASFEIKDGRNQSGVDHSLAEQIIA